jgi:MFS family permease
LCCIIILPNYYCYDNPSALETYIEAELNITATSYGILYSAYAFPNTILPLFGGILLDKIGARNGLLLFSFFLCIGQAIFTIGGFQKSFTIMIVGRFFYGCGCESMYVA